MAFLAADFLAVAFLAGFSVAPAWSAAAFFAGVFLAVSAFLADFFGAGDFSTGSSSTRGATTRGGTGTTSSHTGGGNPSATTATGASSGESYGGATTISQGAIAVTSLNRSAAGLEVATVAESGYPGFEATNWYGLLAPGGTPVEIVATLSEATRKALAVATLRDKLGEIGMEVLASSPEEFTATIKRELPKWSGVIRDAGS